MNIKLSLLAIVEILSGLSIGIVIMIVTYKILKWIGRKRYDIHQNNVAYSIFIASVLFSVGYMVSGVIQPLLSLFRIMAASESSTSELLFSFIGYGAFYIASSYTAGVVVSLVGITIYTGLTPIDEFAEVKNNNLGVALIVGTIIIVLTLLTRDGVNLLMESQIPYPTHFTQ
ncbi:MAG TPA: DUF350 domain-containing protein [Cyclobacteriaceae bacterium]|nr:DUF350 domain-containing protein [Cyclobacteriaceae bacterium]